MENEKRITDREFFEEIRNVFVTGESAMNPDEVIAFCERKIASIQRKTERARELREEKRAAGDEVLELVKNHLTNEWNIAANIAAELSEATGEKYSRQKISSRLVKLVKEGYAVEGDMVLTKENGKKSTAKGYKLAD